MIFQRTIREAVSATGIGLHSGSKVEVSFRPAPANTGIIYTRTDLNPAVSIKCEPDAVRDTQLCTALVNLDGVRISTVEHLTAALCALGIDNLYVDVNAPELPVMDGSSQPFIYLFETTGVQELQAPKKFIHLKRAVRVEDGEKWAEITPGDGFTMDLTIDFNHPAMDRDLQHFFLDFSGESFVRELSRARTFCFMKDVEFMHSHNLALGGSLENAVVLDDYRVINPDGLRYPNEFVKHKMLDAVGDLYMYGHSILGNFRAYKTGHKLNNMLLRAVLADAANYELIEIDRRVVENNAIEFLESEDVTAGLGGHRLILN
ncbi:MULTISPECIES: UDP-3-O-acyl-N-acetylglucosamine deacetylase [unclassified Anaerobiospirillum]|uniref:UDP-3-O-acyl-N-acetylglucosamine deacetylase n=1 Tax=unclassified Anaerobiospirillum TaxID=2647410 RepID=UPI001FF62B77|nr:MULTISPECIES: UDP-3-O-acyl-N-acetylglucosamine deacetylase [unclassified Anaerobiospirillum]MCK0526301.1 UDP-3-O-acyl-N-acetylglucosamine deacetylase [Anaerobiospirillum sp. NML120449]MCK0535316.1 UDP-3-O-acyl-N-acetylglucosamine deacetylase [Anaerobiospirillum sp. NML120511]MCK0540489.1 UDP-3-O-acyl-N-acetylglucosamine deacetylase [Anaerobiospirillum sp. NML02-A-032]